MSDFASAQFENINRGGVHIGSHGSDAGLWVEFHKEPIKQGAESESQGRPIYKDVDFITINFPGDKTKKVCRPVDLKGTGSKPSDPQRFPAQWAAFQAQQEQTQSGTPITEWAPLTKSEALELKGMKIHTVEQLANLPDTALNWLGGRSQRDKAKLWLENATGGSAVTRLQSENESLRQDVEMLRNQVQDLVNMKTPDEPKRGPGRPKTEKE